MAPEDDGSTIALQPFVEPGGTGRRQTGNGPAQGFDHRLKAVQHPDGGQGCEGSTLLDKGGQQGGRSGKRGH